MSSRKLITCRIASPPPSFPAFEQSTKSVEEAARAERERRGQLSQSGTSSPRILSAESSENASDQTPQAVPVALPPFETPAGSSRPSRFAHLAYQVGSTSLPSSPRVGVLPRQPGPPPVGGLPPPPVQPSRASSSPATDSATPSLSASEAQGDDVGQFPSASFTSPRAAEPLPQNDLHHIPTQRRDVAPLRLAESPTDAAFPPKVDDNEPGVSFSMVSPSSAQGNRGAYDNASASPPHDKSSTLSDSLLTANENQPRPSSSKSRLKDLGRPFRRKKGQDSAANEDPDSESDPSVALGSSPEMLGNAALDRDSIDSHSTRSSRSHTSTPDDVASRRPASGLEEGLARRQIRAERLRSGPSSEKSPSRADADVANGTQSHSSTSIDSISGSSTNQRRSLAFLGPVISSGLDDSHGSSLQRLTLSEHPEGDDDDDATPMQSPHMKQRATAGALAQSSSSRYQGHHQEAAFAAPALPGENFTLNSFTGRSSSMQPVHGLPAISPGSAPHSKDYWSLDRSQGEPARSGHVVSRIRSSGNLNGGLEPLATSDSADHLGSQETLEGDVAPSRSGSRLVRAFSKRRPQTSTSEASENRSFSPEFAFGRNSSSTQKGSNEGSRGSLSQEQGAGRTSSVSGSFELQQFPSSGRGGPADGSRLESSGGAAALFGGGASSNSSSRPRTASLLPSLSLFSGGSKNRLSPNGASRGGLGSASSSSIALDKNQARSGSHEHATMPAANGKADELQVTSAKEKKTSKIQPYENEDAAEFAARVEQSADRSDVAGILASSSDKTYTDALHVFMQRFLFVGNPLDIALRKMLMELYLPKETQQIDRVMEAFAKRYNECNEGLYASEDQPYILAFSLMMLHTDAFNRNAKVKMSKADYVKNSSSSGVPQDILEYLYDNLTFTQFVYSNEADSQRKALDNPSSNSSSGFLAQMSGSSKDKNQKIDAYLLIKQGRLSQFQPAIENVIPEDDPYSFTGTADDLNVPQLARAFMSSPSLEIAAQSVPGAAGDGSELLETNPNSVRGMPDDRSVTLRIFKVGIIGRKDDITDKGKKQKRRWKPCGMILSSSQLLFFRDLVWVDALQAQISEQIAAADPEERKRGIMISPRVSSFQPDGVLSLGDAIAVRDESYDKHDWVVRLIGVQGTSQHEYLFHTRDETEMNEWIAGINFAACFRAFGVRVTNIDAMALASAMRDAALSAAALGANAGTPSTPSIRSGYGAAVSPPHPEMLRARIGARKRQLLPLLEEVDRKLDGHASELAELLRLARHFAILTPFQRTTRLRIEAAAVPLAVRIRQLRILVAKNECRRYILASEIQLGDTSCGSPAGETMSREPSQSGGEWNEPSTPITPSILAERKGSYFSNAESEESSSMSPSSSATEGLGLRMMTSGGAHGSGRTGGLGSVSEVSELDPSAAAGASSAGPSTGTSLGSFATQGGSASSAGSQSNTPVTPSSRSFKMKFAGKGSKGKARSDTSEQSEIAESWQSTRAFRDPDRISVAQLPSLEQIEAATREKARRRGMHHAASTTTTGTGSRKGSYAYSGSSVSGSYRTNKKTTSSRKGSSSNRSGGGGSSGSGKTTHLQNQPTDPPVFMHSFGC